MLAKLSSTDSIRKNWRLMHSLFTDVLQFSPLNMVFTLALMLFRSISAGVSLLLILPLLNVIGFSVGPNNTHGVVTTITQVFKSLHLPLNLLTILLTMLFPYHL